MSLCSAAPPAWHRGTACQAPRRQAKIKSAKQMREVLKAFWQKAELQSQIPHSRHADVAEWVVYRASTQVTGCRFCFFSCSNYFIFSVTVCLGLVWWWVCYKVWGSARCGGSPVWWMYSRTSAKTRFSWLDIILLYKRTQQRALCTPVSKSEQNIAF